MNEKCSCDFEGDFDIASRIADAIEFSMRSLSKGKPSIELMAAGMVCARILYSNCKPIEDFNLRANATEQFLDAILSSIPWIESHDNISITVGVEEDVH